MLVALHRLVDGWRHPSRADELAEVRRRFAAAARDDPGPAEQQLAAQLRQQCAELVEKLGSVSSCTSCAKGHPLPAGRYPGGHCCSASTLTVFSELEVAVLHATGTRPGQLKPPRGDHAGCAFRGESSCSLPLERRPTLCLRYLCRQLRDELRKAGNHEALTAARRLDATAQAYEKVRRVRLGQLRGAASGW